MGANITYNAEGMTANTSASGRPINDIEDHDTPETVSNQSGELVGEVRHSERK